MAEKILADNSLIKKNIIANFVGNFWVALLSVAFVPLYIKFLGIEAYGLIGFFTSVQVVLSLLDMGLSFSINRELARLSINIDNAQGMQNLLRTLELVYWAIAFIIVIIILIIAQFLSNNWLNLTYISAKQTYLYLILLGVVFAIRFPYSLYTGALTGLQQLLTLNKLKIVTETMRTVGSVLVLWLISNTLILFLLWQLGVAIFSTCLIRFITWKSIPHVVITPNFDLNILKSIRKFALGSGTIGLTVVILTQIDKIVLSKLLSLETLGYYMLASSLSGGLSLLTSPIFSVYFPKFSQLVAGGETQSLAHNFHRGSQLMSIILLPIGMVLILYSYEIILIWTGSQILAEKTNIVLSLLIIGNMLNGMMQIPYALQLAFGRTKLTLITNIISILLLIPLLIIMINIMGIKGAAIVWLILNLGYFVISPHIMFKYFLIKEKMKWYLNDIIFPFSIVLILGSIFKYAFNLQIFKATIILVIVILSTYVIMLLAVFLYLPWTRQIVLRKIISNCNY